MNIITTGLPYANGTLHLGHIYEWFLADTLSRLSQRTQHPLVWVSGDDAHGVAVAQAAQKAQTDPQVWVEALTRERIEQVQSFPFLNHNYLSTARVFHDQYVQQAYAVLKHKGLIAEVECLQYFSDQPLFERDVVGLCPDCQTEQHLGVCEHCQRSLEPGDLINPVHALSRQEVVLRTVALEHFTWGAFRTHVQEWIRHNTHHSITQKLLHDANELPDLWCIERTGAYFGTPIPSRGTHFYVWFDALFGYFSFSEHLSLNTRDPLAHVIGKDIVSFHALRLPALCAALDLPLPKPLLIHGHIVGEGGRKFSKSAGNAPPLQECRDRWGDDVLRYCVLSNTRGTVDDIPVFPELLDQYQNRLANTYGNTFRRLHKIGGHFPLQALEDQWQQRFDAWDVLIEHSVQSGDTASWIEEGERIVSDLATLIQQNRWWETEHQAHAQQGYVVICRVLERLHDVLPHTLQCLVERIDQQFLDVDDVFFAKA